MNLWRAERVNIAFISPLCHLYLPQANFQMRALEHKNEVYKFLSLCAVRAHKNIGMAEVKLSLSDYLPAGTGLSSRIRFR